MDKRRVNVRGIIWRDGKLLAVKHKKDDGSEADYWAVPGGGLDPHESLVSGVKRELSEEMAITAEVGNLLFVQQFKSQRRGYEEELEFFFHITNPIDFADTIDLSMTSHGNDEIARIQFIDPHHELIYPRFLSTIAIDDYIADHRPVYLFDELA